MSLHTVSPGFKQYQTDLLPAARLPGKKCCLDQDQPWGRFCGENFLNIQCKSDDYDKVFCPTDLELEELWNSPKTKRKE